MITPFTVSEYYLDMLRTQRYECVKYYKLQDASMHLVIKGIIHMVDSDFNPNDSFSIGHDEVSGDNILCKSSSKLIACVFMSNTRFYVQYAWLVNLQIQMI